MDNNKNGEYIKCAICEVTYGVRMGDMPKGTMNWSKSNYALPGFPGTETINFSYSFPSGKKADAHELTMQEASFVPSGDLTVEYALPDRNAELTAWAYRPSASDEPKPNPKRAKQKPASDDKEADAPTANAAIAIPSMIR